VCVNSRVTKKNNIPSSSNGGEGMGQDDGTLHQGLLPVFTLSDFVKGIPLRTNVYEAFDSFDGKSVLWNELPLPRASDTSEEVTSKKKEEFELVHQNLDGNSEHFTVVLAWWNDRENKKIVWITEKTSSLRRYTNTDTDLTTAF
jgi:hypothetical protein